MPRMSLADYNSEQERAQGWRGALGALAGILTRNPAPSPEYGPMSDALAAQYRSGGVLGAIDPYLANPSASPEHQWVRSAEQNIRAGRGATPMPPEAMERISLAGIFAGPGAKTANLEALAQAKNMENSGASFDAIRKITGWFKGMDGKWKFEIPDSQASFTSKYTEAAQAGSPLGNVLTHDQLFAAYPELRDITTSSWRAPTLRVKDYTGAYIPQSEISAESIRVSPSLLGTPKELKQTMLHEIQHAIQQREDFARGSSPLRASYPGMTQEEAYKKMAGEIEAKDVAGRANMSEWQRMSTPPDIRSDAIVQYGDDRGLSRPGEYR